MTDLDTFCETTRAWLTANAPARMRTPARSHDELCWGGTKTTCPADALRWRDVMAERGWTAPSWPVAYGGGGLARPEAKVLAEEMAALSLRPPLIGFGLTMIGPLLLQEGTGTPRARRTITIVIISPPRERATRTRRRAASSGSAHYPSP